DWSQTALGAPNDWSLPLRTLVSVMLGSNQAMFLAWGPQRLMLYNDRYAEILSDKHPGALGQPFERVWQEIIDVVGPMLDRAFAGEPTQMDDLPLVLNRHGSPH